jgi:uncharacterized protein
VFRRRDSAVGAAPRPIGGVYLAAIGAVALVAVAVIAAWLARPSAPKRPLETGVEIALPPVPRGPAVAPVKAEPPPHTDYDRIAAGGDPALMERGASGPLPIVAADGRKSWQAYAAPFDATDRRPRVAVIVTGLGRAAPDTQSAIDKLPPAVTLAFDPYSPDLPSWIGKARAAKHEVLIGVPMEPVDYPREDPGPQTLLTAQEPQKNIDRLEWALSRAVGYVGITNMMGSRFTGATAELRPILETVSGRGLLFVEARVASQSAVAALAREFALPYAVTDRQLDADLSRSGIDQALADLEQLARRKNRAIAAGSLYPITIERVAAWAKTLPDKDLVLAPISAMVTVTSEPKPADKAPDDDHAAAKPGEAKPADAKASDAKPAARGGAAH